MSALAAGGIVLAALLVAARLVWQQVRIDEQWRLPPTCDLCAGRITDFARYVGGGRVLCESCACAADAAQGWAA